MGRRTALWLLAIGALLLALYAAAGFLLLPWLVERHLPEQAAQRLDAELSVGEVSFNPFALRLQAQDLRLAQDAQPPMLTVELLVADLELASLWRRAWLLSLLRLEGVDLRVAFGADGELDWAGLLRERPGAEQGEPPAFAIERAVLQDGRLTVADAQASASVGEIQVEAFDVSNRAGESGRYSLNAALPEGGTLAAEGELALQPAPRSSGEVELAGLRLDAIWPLLRERLHLESPGGRLQFATRYDYAAAAEGQAPGLKLDAIELQLTGAALRPLGREAALLSLELLAGSGGRLDIAARELAFERVRLAKGRLAVNRDAQGEFDWGALGGPEGEPEPKPEPQQAGAPWQARTGALQVEAVALQASDRERPVPLALDIAAIDGITRLDLRFGGGEPVLTRLARLDATLVAPRLAVIGAEAPLLTLDSLALKDGALDSAERRLELEQIAAQGGQAELVFGGDGRLGLATALAGAPEEPTAAEADAGPGWRYRIGELRAEGTALALRHAGYEPAIAYRAELAPATLSRLASAAEEPMQLAATLRFADGGSAQAEARIAQDFASAEGSLRVKQLPLLPLQPALAREARLELRSGLLSADTRLALRSPGGERALSLTGSARIDALRIDEAGSRERFLAWRSLRAEGLRLDTAPARLAIREIELTGPGAKLVIYKDRSVNLTQVLERDREGERKPDGAAGDRPPLQVALERIRIHQGVLDFADLSLVLPFATTIEALNGSVLNITTAAGERARVQAAGEIQLYGSARVNGSLLPFAPTEFLDLRVRMSNVAMPPLSPYTATFAGRKVAEGKLWLELEYHIENGELLGENRILLDDFRLGERVETPDALDLPLDLAVALLTDAQGRIDVAVPVRGDIGDPSFDIGALVREAFVGFLRRVVTAPFRALGRLFGAGEGGDGQLPVIEFVPGSDALLPPQREKLQKLGAALAQRPRLELLVPAAYAPERDREALRRRAARRELARLLGDEPVPGERPGLIAYESERTQRALETLLARVAGADALRALRDARGASGDEAAFYRAVFDRIVASYPLDEAALQLLATRRAEAIRDYLVAEGGAPRERVRTGRIESVEGDERLVSTRLQLEASGAEPGQAARAAQDWR